MSCELTTRDRVKAFLRDTSSENDAEYDATVAGVSARMLEAIPHAICAEERTEVIDSAGFEAIVVKHGPIIEVISVTEGRSTTVVPATDYRIDGRRIVRIRGSLFLGRVNALWIWGDVTVVYRAGYEQDEIPPDLIYAATVQCAYEAKLATGGATGARLGLTGETGGGVDATYNITADGWVELVKETLDIWARKRF